MVSVTARKVARRFIAATTTYYNLKSTTPINEVIRLWVEEGAKANEDSMPVWYSPKDVWPYREYNWTRQNSRGGGAIVDGKRVELPGPLKWDALEVDLKTRGWDPKEPLHLSVGKNGKAKVIEGNHRLAVSREVGLSKVPVFFHFGQRVELSKGHGPMFREAPPSPAAVKKVIEDAVREALKRSAPLPPKEEKKIDELMDLLGMR